jgi:hypothetical protein
MDLFEGIVIEESLTNPEVLKRLQVVSTRVSKVTPDHRTPWLTQWTLHTVTALPDEVASIADELSRALDSAHPSSWYADFKSDSLHYIVFPSKVFVIDRNDANQYRHATEYGISIGITAQQVDFEPHMKKAI